MHFLFVGILTLLGSSHELWAMHSVPTYNKQRSKELKQYLNDIRSTFTLNHTRPNKTEFSQSVKEFIELGANPNIEDSSYRAQAMHLAAETGDVELLKFLLGHRANIEARTIFGNTPLHWAAKNGHKESINLLVDLGANIEAQNNDGDTPLIYAAKNMQKEVVIQLIELGAYPNEKILPAANNSAGEILLTYYDGKAIFPKEPKLHEKVRSKSPDIEIATFLSGELSNSLSININELDGEGQTALSVALVMRNAKSALFLLSQGAEPSVGLYNDLHLASRIPILRQRIVESQLSPYEEIFKISHIRHYFVIRQLEGISKDVFVCIISFWLVLKY